MATQPGFFKWLKKRLKRELRILRAQHALETAHPTVTFEENVQVINARNLTLGRDIYIAKGTIVNCGGEAWCDYQGGITIGDQVYIGPYSVLLGAGGIEIGRRCQFGPGVMLIGQSLNMAKIADEQVLDQKVPPHVFGKIVIEDGVMIGAGTTVLMGVTIGRGSYIHSGSTIKKNVPPYSFVIPREHYKIINRNSPLIRK